MLIRVIPLSLDMGLDVQIVVSELPPALIPGRLQLQLSLEWVRGSLEPGVKGDIGIRWEDPEVLWTEHIPDEGFDNCDDIKFKRRS